MKKLMVLVILLAVALIAAPAIAENEPPSSNTPIGETPTDGAGASAQEEPPVLEPPPAPEPPAPNAAPPSVDPAPDASPSEDPVPEPTTPETPPLGILADDRGPVPGTDDTNTSLGPGGVTSTDTGPDVGEGPGATRDHAVEDDAGEDADDEITDAETADDDEVEAEAREDDRLADRILAHLRDGKKDEDDDGKKDEDDDDGKDEDEDDADEDDVEQNQDQDADSGDVDQDANVINTGDNVNQCVGILQVANTGNAQNATGVTQYDSEADEIELENGSRITLTPQLVVDCRQIILQIVRGERPNESELSRARLREVVRPTSGATLANRTGAGVIVPSSRSGITATPKVLSASSAGRPAGQPRNSARSLPKTGGSYATLLGLGTGALLVGGGLLVRRLAR